MMAARELRFAARRLASDRLITVLAGLSLALGIGANTAIFSVVDAVLLRPLPFPDAGRLVAIWSSNRERSAEREAVSSADFLDLQDRATRFAGMAAYNDFANSLTLLSDSEPVRIRAGLATPGFFDVLGVRPALGRSFARTGGGAAGVEEVLITDGLWRRQFGADPGVVGRKVSLGGSGYVIVGVLPASFRQLGDEVDLFATYGWDPERVRVSPTARQAHNRRAVGRLRPGVSLAQAQQQLAGIVRQLEAEHPATNRGMGVGLTPLREWLAGDTSKPLLILLGAVGFVLLIGCANVANLLLARSPVRLREMAIRSAIGAGRRVLVRQLLLESLMLALLGGAVGLALGMAAMRLLVSVGLESIPGIHGVSLDVRVLLFTLLASVASAVAFGLVPALRVARPSLCEVLNEAGARTTGAGDRLLSLLIVLEVAMALVLGVGAGLLLESFHALVHVDRGFEPEELLTFKISLPAAAYPAEPAIAGLYERLLGQLAALPGVRAAAATSVLPLSGDRWTSDLSVAGQEMERQGEDVRQCAVSPDYFKTMNTRLLAGRSFRAGDRLGAPGVVIVNATLAKRSFRRQDPIGQRVTFDRPPKPDSTWYTVVGVVADQRQEDLAQAPRPELYRPYQQWPQPEMTLLLRGTGGAGGLARAVRAVVRQVDPGLPVYDVAAMTQVIAGSLVRRRFTTWLLSIFAALAVLQAVVGVYGVIAYAVSRRAREISIRMALGAQRGAMMAMVLRRGMALVAAGAALGALGAAWLTRVLATQLFAVRALDPPTFAVVIALLCLGGALACWLPAWQATRSSPARSLRQE